MIRTCSYVYPSGKTCGRIPRRGESLCRDHRRLAAPEPSAAEEAFDQEMYCECDRLAPLPLDQVLSSAQQHLNALDSLLTVRSRRRERACCTKAVIAVTTALDCILSQRSMLLSAIPGLTPEQADGILRILWHAPNPGETGSAS
jgi:hypothetical protein